jgi:PAS domain S-box-containing protein
MTVDTKRLHLLVDDAVALLAAMRRSGLLIVGGRLNTCGEWMRRRMVAIRWKAILERQIVNKKAREKEAWLARQLTDSADAAVLLDDKHRLLMANRAALSMLGISERNINKFTMDTFFSYRESSLEGVRRSSVKNGAEWRICKIRRLDGSSMVGEFIFQANVSAGRHLSRFRNVVSCRHVPSQISKVGVGSS